MSQNKLVIDEDGYILEMPVEKAIEILNPIFVNPKVGRANGKTRTVFNQQIAWLTILGELKEKRKEGQWISVKDRLPTEDGRYLVMVDGKSEPIMKDWKQGLFVFINLADLKRCGEETHWMPLPKGPKKEGKT